MSDQVKQKVLKAVGIPDLSCIPKFSALRLPNSDSFRDTDVTGISAIYQFSSDDFELDWVHTGFSVSPDGVNVDTDPDICDVSENINTLRNDFRFISWLSAVKAAMGNRRWIHVEDFPCRESDGSDVPADSGGYYSAAGHPSARPSFIPAPTVAPRWSGTGGRGGGGGGKDEPTLTEATTGCRIGRVKSVDVTNRTAEILLYHIDSDGELSLSNETVVARCL